MESTREISVADESNVQYETNETPTQDVLDEHDHSVKEKPTEGDVFDNFDEAYNMYLEYAEKARFSIRKSTTKRKKGEITHKYILCSKAGKPRKTMVKDTLVHENQNEVNQNEGVKKIRKKRNSNFTVTDCKAAVRFKAIRGTTCYKLYDFVENHNHPLVDENNMDTLRARRKYQFCIYLLAWMGWDADIEGRGLGELCIYDKMFSFKET
ncbi:FAR1-related sequence 5-like protein [Tanacetum coccineum]